MHIKNSKTNHEKDVFKECSDRMHAIANIHGKVYFEKNLLRINIKEFLFEDQLDAELQITTSGLKLIFIEYVSFTQ